MCITVNKAKLSKTKILSIPVGNGNHFIAYSNSVKNTSGRPNAMIFAVPGKTKQEWFYDTTKYKDFLDEIIDNSDLIEDYYGIRSRGLSKGFLGFESFEVGNYKVGLADSFNGAIEFINSQPRENRPVISDSLQKFFETNYFNLSFVVCLFSSEKTIDAQPIAFEYEPFFSDQLYFPTMDSHDGEAPSLSGLVEADHTFIYEHTGESNRKLYKEAIELKADVPVFLKKRRYRTVELNGMVKNGDTFISLNELKNAPFSEDAKMTRK
jgi:hypothetical protein